MGWENSTRRSRLPADWAKTRERILTRDPICTCRGCHRCTDTGCLRSSTDCDHVIPVDDHRDSNLHGLCRYCHAAKTSSEAAAARRALGSARRPREAHPGLR